MEKPHEYRPADYSLIGKDSALAVEKGLAEAPGTPRRCPRRRCASCSSAATARPSAIRCSGSPCSSSSALRLYLLWGSVVGDHPLRIYGVLYASTSDSRWHESEPRHGLQDRLDEQRAVRDRLVHGAARIDALALEPHPPPQRHDHRRARPRDRRAAPAEPASSLSSTSSTSRRCPQILHATSPLHCTGRLTPEESTYIPESEHGQGHPAGPHLPADLRRGDRRWRIATGSILPLMFIGLPSFYGAWLMVIYGYTQHAGLAENVLDHRLNCRTVYMNRINRYLYWNMNYHVEHHMFPLVPYHALPKLHELVKADMPAALPTACWKPTARSSPPCCARSRTRPTIVKRQLPAARPPRRMRRRPPRAITGDGQRRSSTAGSRSAPASLLQDEDVIRFDHDAAHLRHLPHRRRPALRHRRHLHPRQRPPGRRLVKGTLIECPKHNGRFDIRDGSPQRLPVCVALKTYAGARDGRARCCLDLTSAGGLGVTEPQPPTPSAWSATTTSPPSSRNWCWSRSPARRP